GLYALAIVYSSLQPFSPWMWPDADVPFFLVAGWPAYWTRGDVLLNIVAYVPLGFFLALLPQQMTPMRRAGLAFALGAALSFAMETLQMAIPTRDASVLDLFANSAGALFGGVCAATLAGDNSARVAVREWRQRVFLAGRTGDVGMALLALWLVAQLNPGIPMFAVTYANDNPYGSVGNTFDGAALLIEAAESAFQLLGIGVFLALLMRNRGDAAGAVLLLIGIALLGKGVAAVLLLKPAVWQAWIRPGVLIGIAAGSLLMPIAINLPRPAQVALSTVLLLSSILTPLLAPELLLARAPAALFDWRYGQLLNYNGLTRAALLAWPFFAAAWLFALAGRPRWGAPDAVA
ncbi:MAG TPA: VanZ family protein, partial [Casimicrobiaceae bacterium]|nr:VanZ family protein [Casimicrobiaceae bacterium]